MNVFSLPKKLVLYAWFQTATRAKLLVHRLDLKRIESIYGKLPKLKCHRKYEIRGLPNESGIFCGEAAQIIRSLPGPIDSVLLAGEGNSWKEDIRHGLRPALDGVKIVTAGLGDNVDLKWDYEQDPPAQLQGFSLVVSQAMLEHLVDPYKHVKDLSALLAPGGYLLLHTVMPGYSYHRYPIDCFRFYPDWFEEIANPRRCNLKIHTRLFRGFHIFYCYQKP